MISRSCRIEFRRVGGEAEDVAGVGDDADPFPFEQHLAIFGDLVLPLFGGDQIRGVDVLEPDEHAGDAGALRFVDEVFDLVTQRVDLDHEADVHAVLFAQLDDPVVDRFPILVAGEVVVGDEEALDPLSPIHADDLLDAVGGAIAGLASLHIDDGAEGALERATATGIETRRGSDRPLDKVERKEGRRGDVADVRQVLHVIVERTKLAARGVEQHLVEAFLGLARVNRNAEILRGFDVSRDLFQHGQATGDMEAAEHHLDSRLAQRARNIYGAGEFVRLHADNPDQTETAIFGDAASNRAGAYARVGLVHGVDVDRQVGAK